MLVEVAFWYTVACFLVLFAVAAVCCLLLQLVDCYLYLCFTSMFSVVAIMLYAVAANVVSCCCGVAAMLFVDVAMLFDVAAMLSAIGSMCSCSCLHITILVFTVARTSIIPQYLYLKLTLSSSKQISLKFKVSPHVQSSLSYITNKSKSYYRGFQVPWHKIFGHAQTFNGGFELKPLSMPRILCLGT